MNRSILFVAIVLLTTTVHSASTFDITIDETDIIITANLTISSEDPVNYWELSWVKPANATITSISDRYGPIESYDVHDNSMTITTNRGDPRTKDQLSIDMRIPDGVNTEYAPIHQIDLSLPGFKNENTTIVVNTTNILSGKASLGFSEYYTNNAFIAKGQGPATMKVLYSQQQPRYEHFFITDAYNISAAEELYYIPRGVTGHSTPYPRFAIAVLPDTEYQKEAWGWSDGTYLGAGLIVMPQSAFKNETPVATILHEVTHGINEQVLQWDRSNQSWFDEGTAKYVEFLTERKRNERIPAIFGEVRHFTKNGQRYILRPRHTPNDLWRYYQNEPFMHRWHPSKAQVRSFGYAFSELFIRSYISKQAPDALHTIYRQLGQLQDITYEPRVSSRIILDTMNTSLRPCFANSKSVLKTCTERLNQANYSIPLVSLNNTNTQDLEQILPSSQQSSTQEATTCTYSDSDSTRSETTHRSPANRLTMLWDRFTTWANAVLQQLGLI